jgi:hypothetical protein
MLQPRAFGNTFWSRISCGKTNACLTFRYTFTVNNTAQLRVAIEKDLRNSETVWTMSTSSTAHPGRGMDIGQVPISETDAFTVVSFEPLSMTSMTTTLLFTLTMWSLWSPSALFIHTALALITATPWDPPTVHFKTTPSVDGIGITGAGILSISILTLQSS